jgi:hypothetical protein
MTPSRWLPAMPVRQDDVDRTRELLDTRRPQDLGDEAILAVVRALQPSEVVPPAERFNEKAMLLRAAGHAAQAAPATGGATTVDDSALHVTTIPLGPRREVTMVDLEPLTGDRVAQVTRVVSDLIVEVLPTQRDSGS